MKVETFQDKLPSLQAAARWQLRVCLSPDGRHLLGAGTELVLWDIESFAVLARLKLPYLEVGNELPVCFQGNSRVIFGLKSGELRAWDWESGEVTPFSTLESEPLDLASIPNSDLLLSGEEGKALRVWDSEGTLVTKLKGPRSSVKRLAVSPNAELVAASVGPKIHLWNVSDWKKQKLTLGPTSGQVGTLQFAADSQSLLVADQHSAKGFTVQYSLEDGKELWRRDRDVAACLLPSGESLSAGFDAIRKLQSEDSIQYSRAKRLYAAGERVFVSSLRTSRVRVLDSNTLDFLDPAMAHGGTVRGIRRSRDGHRVLSFDSQELIVWDAQSGTPVLNLKRPGLSDALFGLDSDTLWLVSEDKVEIWEGEKLQSESEPIKNHVRRITLVANERYLVAFTTASRGSGPGELSWFDLETQKEVWRTPFRSRDFKKTLFLSDDTLAVMGLPESCCFHLGKEASELPPLDEFPAGPESAYLPGSRCLESSTELWLDSPEERGLSRWEVPGRFSILGDWDDRTLLLHDGESLELGLFNTVEGGLESLAHSEHWALSCLCLPDEKQLYLGFDHGGVAQLQF